MPKSSVKQIEQDERKILYELTKNANKSINDIAKTCRFSRQKVWRVIKNMEKNHTIWGYTAVTDKEKLGKKGFIFLIKRSNKPVSQEIKDHIINRDLTDKVEKIGIAITDSYFTNGKYDWILCFTANDTAEAKSFIEIFIKIYEEFISETYLMEKMFTVVNSEVTNPEIKKLNDFFKV